MKNVLTDNLFSRRKLERSILASTIALTVTACTGSGVGGIAGIGGSGYISSGTVTGFGSVFVNGVKFETSNTVFDIDDSGAGSQSDLAIGMVVTVEGTVNSDGITGTADRISFDDQLQGPVSNLTAPDADGVNRTFRVLGTTVRISSLNTVFDVTGILNGTPFGFDQIAHGHNVEISGFFNTAGELIATRVELKATSFSTSNIVELKGSVTGYTGTSSPFTLTGLPGISINASSAMIDDLPGGISNGASVEVKGTCSDAACSTLNATRVEGQSGFDDASKISVEGLITDYVDDSNFKVNGIDVDASTATLIPSTLTLTDGARVEVEGPISNNTIRAISVEQRGGNAEVHATITSVDNATGDFVVTANATPIAITVTTATETEGNISAGNFVRIRGFENSAGGVTATRVEVRSDDDVIVQGKLQSFTADSSITVLGVTFTIDYNGGSGETDFENTADATITQGQFISLAPPGTLVKVKDKNDEPVAGVADEVDIELP